MTLARVHIRPLEVALEEAQLPAMTELLLLRSLVATAAHHGVIWKRDLPALARDIPNPAKHAGRLVDAGLWDDFDGWWCIASDGMAEQCSRRRADDRWKLTAELRARVLERDGWSCNACGAVDNLVIDHIHPIARGGRTEFDNLQPLCAPCNGSKGIRSWDEFLEATR